MRVIIGITGIAGSGKTLVAKYLVENRDFERHRFADPIKRMLREGLGLTEAQLDGHEKSAPIPELGGITPRRLMQTLGTEWGRRMVHRNIWIEALRTRLLDAHPWVVVDDVRSEAEARFIRGQGGVIWHVMRPGREPMDHITERDVAAVGADELIMNAGSVADLHKSVDSLLAS